MQVEATAKACKAGYDPADRGIDPRLCKAGEGDLTVASEMKIIYKLARLIEGFHVLMFRR